MRSDLKNALFFASMLTLTACSETRVHVTWPAQKPQATNFVAPAPATLPDPSSIDGQVAAAPIVVASAPPVLLAPPAGASSAWAATDAPAAVVATPAAKPPVETPATATTAPIAVAGVPAPLETWSANRGDYLRDVLDRWMVQAHMPPVDYELSDPNDDWTLDLPFIVHGDVKQAIKALCDGVHTKTRPIPILFDNGLMLKDQI